MLACRHTSDLTGHAGFRVAYGHAVGTIGFRSLTQCYGTGVLRHGVIAQGSATRTCGLRALAEGGSAFRRGSGASANRGARSCRSLTVVTHGHRVVAAGHSVAAGSHRTDAGRRGIRRRDGRIGLEVSGATGIDVLDGDVGRVQLAHVDRIGVIDTGSDVGDPALQVRVAYRDGIGLGSDGACAEGDSTVCVCADRRFIAQCHRTITACTGFVAQSNGVLAQCLSLVTQGDRVTALRRCLTAHSDGTDTLCIGLAAHCDSLVGQRSRTGANGHRIVVIGTRVGTQRRGTVTLSVGVAANRSRVFTPGVGVGAQRYGVIAPGIGVFAHRHGVFA
ncbi:hypothetical protein D3C78_403990 [compost metagenome]